MKPKQGDYAAYYHQYIELVSATDVLIALEQSMADCNETMTSIPEVQLHQSYAQNKWTIAEVIMHIIDSERVFAYRALRFARRDATPLPGYDHDAWVAHSQAAGRSLEDLKAEFEQVRGSTLSLFKSFDEEALQQRGIANEKEISVNALGFVIAGHQLHHMQVISRLYLSATPAT